MPPPGEFELIERFFASRARRRGVEVGIGDDAAIVHVSGRMAVAVDTLVEGVHFPADMPAHCIGHRALAVNVSDMAAMGLAPDWFTLALTLPAVDQVWLEEFVAGLDKLVARYDIALVGGDTTRGPLAVTIQVMADAGADAVLTRAGARPGDAIYVSGTLGDAAAVVAGGDRELPDALLQRFRYPEPRVATGQAMRGVATAAIDVSDGLLADLGHICRASRCGARVDAARLPLSPALLQACSRESALGFALSGGDDYELCLTVPPPAEAELGRIAAATGTPLTRIGECTAGDRVELLFDGRAYAHAATGYRHF